MKTLKIKQITAEYDKIFYNSGVMDDTKMSYNHLNEIIGIKKNDNTEIFVFDRSNKVIYCRHNYVISGLLGKEAKNLSTNEYDDVLLLIEIVINRLCDLDNYSAYKEFKLLKKNK